jgi:hypothetical protein
VRKQAVRGNRDVLGCDYDRCAGPPRLLAGKCGVWPVWITRRRPEICPPLSAAWARSLANGRRRVVITLACAEAWRGGGSPASKSYAARRNLTIGRLGWLPTNSTVSENRSPGVPATSVCGFAPGAPRGHKLGEPVDRTPQLNERIRSIFIEAGHPRSDRGRRHKEYVGSLLERPAPSGPELEDLQPLGGSIMRPSMQRQRGHPGILDLHLGAK